MDELSRLADEVVVLDNGQAVAVGPVGEVLARGDLPALSGEEAATVIQGAVVERDPRWHLAHIQLKDRCILVRDSGLAPGSRLHARECIGP
ncbi:MAG TPA: hypothetical protein PLT48_18430 [Nitrospira sp.]|nr:hypothetical protein [Nitrospira sp.]